VKEKRFSPQKGSPSFKPDGGQKKAGENSKKKKRRDKSYLAHKNFTPGVMQEKGLGRRSEKPIPFRKKF